LKATFARCPKSAPHHGNPRFERGKGGRGKGQLVPAQAKVSGGDLLAIEKDAGEKGPFTPVG